jgi:mono/diheme cytochrome c family protein
MARMPVYAGREIDPFPAAFRKYDFTPKERVPRDATAEKGRELFSERGKNCVQCHQPDPDGVQTLPGINLQHAPDRLRFSWFRQAVVNPAETLQGAPMPDMFPDDESGKDDTAAIWKYLESLRD